MGERKTFLPEKDREEHRDMEEKRNSRFLGEVFFYNSAQVAPSSVIDTKTLEEQ